MIYCEQRQGQASNCQSTQRRNMMANLAEYSEEVRLDWEADLELLYDRHAAAEVALQAERDAELKQLYEAKEAAEVALRAEQDQELKRLYEAKEAAERRNY